MAESDDELESRDYLVVEFLEEAIDGSLPLAVVPSVWVSLKKKICFWPNFRNDQEKTKAVMKKIPFDFALCKSCPIKVKYKTNSYEKAVNKLKSIEKCESVSSLSSQSEEDELSKKRKSKPKPVFREFDCNSYELTKKISVLPIKKKQNRLSESSEDSCPEIPGPSKDIVDSDQEAQSENDITLVPERIKNGFEPSVNFLDLQKICRENRALLDNINRKVELLAEDVKFLTQITQRNSIVETLENIQHINFPISTEAEMIEFNEKLGNNEEFFKDACASLLCVGGKDVNDSTRRLLGKVISHSLSLQYNWTGRGKKTFADLKHVQRLFLVCLRRNPLTKNATESEIASIVKVWLRTAADRMGGRSKRNKKPDGDENIE